MAPVTVREMFMSGLFRVKGYIKKKARLVLTVTVDRHWAELCQPPSHLTARNPKLAPRAPWDIYFWYQREVQQCRQRRRCQSSKLLGLSHSPPCWQNPNKQQCSSDSPTPSDPNAAGPQHELCTGQQAHDRPEALEQEATHHVRNCENSSQIIIRSGAIRRLRGSTVPSPLIKTTSLPFFHFLS